MEWEVVFADDDVVADGDAADVASLDEFAGDLFVGVAGLADAGGVVVDEDDGGGAGEDGAFENFTGGDDEVFEGADGDDFDVDDLVAVGKVDY